MLVVYGPRQPTSGAYAIVTGVFMRQFQQNTPLTIEGDGSHSRDFIHAQDIAEGLILSQQNEDLKNTVINLGTGKGYSVKNVADMISPKQTHLPERKNDLVATLADTCRMKEMLGFTPVKDFKDEITNMVKDVEAGDVSEQLPSWFTPARQKEAPWLLSSDENQFEHQNFGKDLDGLLKLLGERVLLMLFDGANWKLMIQSVYSYIKTTGTSDYIILCRDSEEFNRCSKFNLVCHLTSSDNAAIVKAVAAVKKEVILTEKSRVIRIHFYMCRYSSRIFGIRLNHLILAFIQTFFTRKQVKR